jgi:hypothetical protein
MDDNVSQWLLDNWYIPYRNHPNMLLACALARFINNPDTLAAVGFPTRWNPERIKAKIRDYRDKPLWRGRPKPNKVFNAAYMVRGNDGTDKIDAVITHYVSPLKGLQIDPSSMENTWKLLLPSYGMGSFMAGQIVADLRWASNGLWTDRYTWAPMGPGSMRGMNRIDETPLRRQLKQADFNNGLLQITAGLKLFLSPAILDRLELMDLQNVLCETDKYNRVLLGEGRPKQKYLGV